MSDLGNEVVQVRAKMQCTEVRQAAGGNYVPGVNGGLRLVPGIVTTFTLVPVSPQGDEETENNLFANQSPSGEFKLQIRNERAAEMFRPGRSYYVDISPAPAE